MASSDQFALPWSSMAPTVMTFQPLAGEVTVIVLLPAATVMTAGP
jgi:hypothetical protein